MKIYISSTCVKHEYIKDSVEELARHGFKNIELSGGTKYYQTFAEDLLELKERYGLDFLLHGYFPPPEEDFILNLASLNGGIYEQSLKHYERALALSRRLGGRKYGMHAGFFMDPTPREIGKDIAAARLYDEDKAVTQFCEGLNHLKTKADGIELYVENNVLSSSNARTFEGRNPFMMTDYAGYAGLKRRVDFKLLVDVAHLHVSAHSLGLDFAAELDRMLPLSDYVHLSDNDGLHDQSRCFKEDSAILKSLKRYDLTHKIVTLETYGNIADIKASHAIVQHSLSHAPAR